MSAMSLLFRLVSGLDFRRCQKIGSPVQLTESLGPSHKGYGGVQNIHFPPLQSTMPSDHHPHLDHLDRPALHNLLLGFSSFVILCGIKALQIMQHQEPPKKNRVRWTDEEAEQMIDVLINHKAKMGQAASFGLPTFNIVAKQLGTTRQASSYLSKFNGV